MSRVYQNVSLTIDAQVAEIVLERGDSFNAIDHGMHDELVDVFAYVATLPDIRAILLSAKGKVFSAGGDFDLILIDHQRADRREAMATDARNFFRAITQCPLPIVTALHGDVVGLGTTLVLGSDAIVAARAARISDPHVVIGLAAGDGGCVLWPQTVGLLRAKRYLLTGDRLTAEEAHAIGLVTDLVDHADQVRDAAMTLAKRIASLPPLGVQATKRALNEGLRHRTEEVFELGIQGELDSFFSEDLVEAVTAFRERRSGHYRGR